MTFEDYFLSIATPVCCFGLCLNGFSEQFQNNKSCSFGRLCYNNKSPSWTDLYFPISRSMSRFQKDPVEEGLSAKEIILIH